MSDSLDQLATHEDSRHGVSGAELAFELGALGARWSVERGVLTLVLAGAMSDTGVAAAFCGTLADELDHHPSIVLDGTGLMLTIRTPDTDGVTVLDLVFAARVEQWLRSNGWPAT